MKKPDIMKTAFMIALTFALCAVFALPAAADMGPKPSVTVKIKNAPEGEMWATLLSEAELGPFDEFKGGSEDEYEYYYENSFYSENGKPDYNVWRAVTDYKDPDGYRFLQRLWLIDESGEFTWGYMVPDNFKVLLYFPADGAFLTSEISPVYAFDSYYEVDLEGVDVSKSGGIQVHASYNVKKELIGLFGRFLLTVLIEMAVAILFGFSRKKPLLLILGVNAVTQIVLNVALNLLSRRAGIFGLMGLMLLCEVAVIAIEATVYCIYMKRLEPAYDNERYLIGYAAVANIASFVAGFAFALLFPAIY